MWRLRASETPIPGARGETFVRRARVPDPSGRCRPWSRCPPPGNGLRNPWRASSPAGLCEAVQWPAGAPARCRRCCVLPRRAPSRSRGWLSARMSASEPQVTKLAEIRSSPSTLNTLQYAASATGATATTSTNATRPVGDHPCSARRAVAPAGLRAVPDRHGITPPLGAQPLPPRRALPETLSHDAEGVVPCLPRPTLRDPRPPLDAPGSLFRQQTRIASVILARTAGVRPASRPAPAHPGSAACRRRCAARPPHAPPPDRRSGWRPGSRGARRCSPPSRAC